jgi:hypothetical protein
LKGPEICSFFWAELSREGLRRANNVGINESFKVNASPGTSAEYSELLLELWELLARFDLFPPPLPLRWNRFLPSIWTLSREGRSCEGVPLELDRLEGWRLRAMESKAVSQGDLPSMARRGDVPELESLR